MEDLRNIMFRLQKNESTPEDELVLEKLRDDPEELYKVTKYLNDPDMSIIEQSYRFFYDAACSMNWKFGEYSDKKELFLSHTFDILVSTNSQKVDKWIENLFIDIVNMQPDDIWDNCILNSYEFIEQEKNLIKVLNFYKILGSCDDCNFYDVINEIISNTAVKLLNILSKKIKEKDVMFIYHYLLNQQGLCIEENMFLLINIGSDFLNQYIKEMVNLLENIDMMKEIYDLNYQWENKDPQYIIFEAKMIIYESLANQCFVCIEDHEESYISEIQIDNSFISSERIYIRLMNHFLDNFHYVKVNTTKTFENLYEIELIYNYLSISFPLLSGLIHESVTFFELMIPVLYFIVENFLISKLSYSIEDYDEIYRLYYKFTDEKPYFEHSDKNKKRLIDFFIKFLECCLYWNKRELFEYFCKKITDEIDVYLENKTYFNAERAFGAFIIIYRLLNCDNSNFLKNILKKYIFNEINSEFIFLRLVVLNILNFNNGNSIENEFTEEFIKKYHQNFLTNNDILLVNTYKFNFFLSLRKHPSMITIENFMFLIENLFRIKDESIPDIYVVFLRKERCIDWVFKHTQTKKMEILTALSKKIVVLLSKNEMLSFNNKSIFEKNSIENKIIIAIQTEIFQKLKCIKNFTSFLRYQNSEFTDLIAYNQEIYGLEYFIDRSMFTYDTKSEVLFKEILEKLYKPFEMIIYQKITIYFDLFTDIIDIIFSNILNINAEFKNVFGFALNLAESNSVNFKKLDGIIDNYISVIKKNEVEMYICPIIDHIKFLRHKNHIYNHETCLHGIKIISYILLNLNMHIKNHINLFVEYLISCRGICDKDDKILVLYLESIMLSFLSDFLETYKILSALGKLKMFFDDFYEYRDKFNRVYDKKIVFLFCGLIFRSENNYKNSFINQLKPFMPFYNTNNYKTLDYSLNIVKNSSQLSIDTFIIKNNINVIELKTIFLYNINTYQRAMENFIKILKGKNITDRYLFKESKFITTIIDCFDIKTYICDVFTDLNVFGTDIYDSFSSSEKKDLLNFLKNIN